MSAGHYSRLSCKTVADRMYQAGANSYTQQSSIFIARLWRATCRWCWDTVAANKIACTFTVFNVAQAVKGPIAAILVAGLWRATGVGFWETITANEVISTLPVPNVAQSAADVVLMRPLVGSVLAMISASRASVQRIWFNFAWSFVYNTAAVLFASGAAVRARIPPEFAGLGELVSVLPVIVAAGALALVRFVNS
ncbi:hypothetical protein NQ176_g3623 [Zarea fungicola]|uniref:Uncharacterized protein n=1 Tax=Zarea fungicola TaxID=93591 RepID=A0ACC1NJ04_9HYPO|nr:hypothetical protein NQ176_g3623 [Lecanicillium fungicola]